MKILKNVVLTIKMISAISISGDLMNYNNEIKEILINNEITKKVKDYSKNKSDLESYYKVN